MTDEICCGSSFGTFEEQDKVLVALSGGVDSSVVAALLIKAIGKNLICVHVNHGLMRKGESEQVVDVFKNQMDANLVYCAGRTPSPCVLCNPRVKFAALSRVADRLGIRYIATGHYARVTEENGLYYVRAAVSPERPPSAIPAVLSA